jgi:hypothetical protein
LKKAIIISSLSNGREISFHRNIIISDSTSETDYINQVLPIINPKYEAGYLNDNINVLIIKCISLDNYINTNNVKNLKKN